MALAVLRAPSAGDRRRYTGIRRNVGHAAGVVLHSLGTVSTSWLFKRMTAITPSVTLPENLVYFVFVPIALLRLHLRFEEQTCASRLSWCYIAFFVFVLFYLPSIGFIFFAEYSVPLTELSSVFFLNCVVWCLGLLRVPFLFFCSPRLAWCVYAISE